jgi:hypothetical protein
VLSKFISPHTEFSVFLASNFVAETLAKQGAAYSNEGYHMRTSKYSPITKSQVAGAAAELSTRSVPVAARSVRGVLGGGSYATITRYLRELRD